jgi:hypothetical protein
MRTIAPTKDLRTSTTCVDVRVFVVVVVCWRTQRKQAGSPQPTPTPATRHTHPHERGHRQDIGVSCVRAGEASCGFTKRLARLLNDHKAQELVGPGGSQHRVKQGQVARFKEVQRLD